MIKINLLPVKAAKRREQGQKQLAAGAGILAAGLIGIFLLHSSQVTRNQSLKQRTEELTRQIAKLKSEVGDYDLIRAQRDELIKQRDAIRRLQANRSGPTYMMRELSDILTSGKGPTNNKEQYAELLKRDPNAGYNQGWDPRRAWLINYSEQNHQVKIKGGAKSDEDVAEFLKRLKQSTFFSDVYWQQTQPEFDTKLNVSFVTFDVSCRVNY